MLVDRADRTKGLVDECASEDNIRELVTASVRLADTRWFRGVRVYGDTVTDTHDERCVFDAAVALLLSAFGAK